MGALRGRPNTCTFVPQMSIFHGRPPIADRSLTIANLGTSTRFNVIINYLGFRQA
jgi:hypothetical protein